MSDDSDFHFSDGELDEGKHVKIVENVLTLNKTQHLKRPSRTEPSSQISEFTLVKSIGNRSSVNIGDLGKVLATKKKHAKISKTVKVAEKKGHTLPKPLEKPHAERLQRSVGYERNRYLLDRWEAFVTANRAQSHQIFPLERVKKIKNRLEKPEKFSNNWKIKSDLQQELETLNTKVEEYVITEDPKNKYPLTLSELKQKQREAAKLRIHQSFKEAKSRRQNKIKSKKYHRILRKEMMKQKLKEFEELQKIDPEKALKKLEEIEKARALERFSLRHRGTSKWAKSKQVRAKYDKKSRQVLAEQIRISRDLTQKQKHPHSDSDDSDVEDADILKPKVSKNPWFTEPIPDKEVASFVSEYKKFWAEQNATETDPLENSDKIENNLQNDTSKILLEENNLGAPSKKKVQERQKKKCVKKTLSKKESFKIPPDNESDARLNSSSGDWDIEEIFFKAKRKINEKLKKKILKNEENRKKVPSKIKIKKNTVAFNKKIDLKMAPQVKKQIIDEEMIEIPSDQWQGELKNDDIFNLKNIISNNSTSFKNSSLPQIDPLVNINMESFMKPKISELDSSMPDIMSIDENVEEISQKSIIMEAFEDNDIADDFTKEKQEELDKDKLHEVDLNLPGWGSWAGTSINPKTQGKRRSLILKFPKVPSRRDSNHGSLIVNEKAAVNIKPHLVSDIPFPFKTVKDYEASIRTPIGNTFVPELAYRKFIRPSVEVKMGTIIEPVTTSLLMGKPTS